MTDTYHTLDGSGRAEHTVDGSRFLAEAAAVASRAAAEETIAAVRAREHKATHHCSAYRLGVTGDTFRYDDDGEPSGTAGRPILRQIDARDLTNTLVVVTRYFGGTELGTGGLARAYGDAAAAALERADKVERVVRTPLRIRYDYDDTAPAERVLRQFDADVRASEYTDVTTLTVGVRQSEVDAFVDALTNALSDRGDVLRVGR
ncbi:putative YigZ family protein [Salinibacter ruber]|uniref:IMPACT family protein n=1 Tax=Salinibacter ruber TaxID=146919 RepID=UPI0021678444|nr:YigZ family protein [Salinibacter ruber]MCS4193012.1 putative YigZ family protein [Salinibacter ruber]